MGRKSCLFVYYVKLIGTELWMVEEAVALNGVLENRTVEGKIRKRIWKQCKKIFFLSSSISGYGRFDVSWLVVVFDFCCVSDYIMANNISLVGINSIRGWC